MRRPPSPSQDLEDGPLFRASVAFNERRAKALRNSLKIFAKSAADSLSILQANAAAQTAMDDHLGALCSGTSSDVLSALYSGNLKARRSELAEHSRKEVEELRILLDRVEETVERLKTVEKKRRAFESESKKHYEELAKVRLRSRRLAPAPAKPESPAVPRPNRARLGEGSSSGLETIRANRSVEPG